MNIPLAIVLGLSASAALLGARVVQQGLMTQRDRRAVDRRLAVFASKPVDGYLSETSAFGILVRRLARLSLMLSRDHQSQVRSIREAGIFVHGAVDRFLALRAALPISGFILGLASGTAIGLAPMATTMLTVGLAVAGYFGPAIVLSHLGRRRRKRVFREMPLFLDSVKMLLQTGASLELTLRQIARMDTTAIPEIRRTLTYLLQDLDQGKSYHLAFDRWVEKLAVPDAEELAGLMLQSTRYGTELTPMLEQFIQDQIQRRLALARETAGKRSVSLTVVMVVFFLPPLIVVVGAPAVVEIARTLIK